MFWMTGSWNEQEILHLRPEFQGFAVVGGYRPGDATLQVTGQPLRMVGGVTATAELFEVLGVSPMIGREGAAAVSAPDSGRGASGETQR